MASIHAAPVGARERVGARPEPSQPPHEAPVAPSQERRGGGLCTGGATTLPYMSSKNEKHTILYYNVCCRIIFVYSANNSGTNHHFTHVITDSS